VLCGRNGLRTSPVERLPVSRSGPSPFRQPFARIDNFRSIHIHSQSGSIGLTGLDDRSVATRLVNGLGECARAG
jgi:hypothetical protein